MDENLKKTLLAKYPDDSEEVKSLRVIVKDRAQTRLLIERIYCCQNEKELVSNVLVGMYVNGRTREQLCSSAFIETLLKFSYTPMKVRSVQRYIRNIFDTPEVQAAYKKAQDQRYESFRKSNIADPNEISATLIFPDIDKFGRRLYDDMICLLRSNGIHFENIAPSTWVVDHCRGYSDGEFYSEATPTIHYRDRRMLERHSKPSSSCVISCSAKAMPKLMSDLQVLFGSLDPVVEYISPNHSKAKIPLSIAILKAEMNAGM